MSRGRLFGSKELTRTPIADVMAGVGGKLGGAYAQNVHQSRAQQRADEQRQAEKDFKVDVAWAQSGGESVQEQQRQAELAALKDVYGEDLDAVAEEAGQTVETLEAAEDPFEEAIEFVAQQKDGFHGPLPPQDRGPARVLPEENLTPLQLLERQRNEAGFDNLHNYAVQTQYEDDIDAVTKEIGELYGKEYGAASRVPGFGAEQKADEARLAELEGQLEERVAVHDTLANQDIFTADDLDAASREAGFDVEMLGRREQLREEVPRLDQIGQNVRAGMGPDGGEMAKARQRLADSGFYGARDGSEDPRFEVLRERFPDEALTTVDAVNRALSFTNRLEDRYKEEFDAGREETTQGRHLRREWSGIADQRQRQWELTRRASDAYQKAREEPLETDDEAKQRVRLAQGEMLAAAADITGINAGGNIEDIQSRADAGSGPIASIANMILAYREGHTLKPGAVDDLAKMIHAHGQLAFENWHDEFEAYKRTAAEDDFTIDRWAPANTHPTPREEAEGVWKALTNFEEF